MCTRQIQHTVIPRPNKKQRCNIENKKKTTNHLILKSNFQWKGGRFELELEPDFPKLRDIDVMEISDRIQPHHEKIAGSSRFLNNSPRHSREMEAHPGGKIFHKTNFTTLPKIDLWTQ